MRKIQRSITHITRRERKTSLLPPPPRIHIHIQRLWLSLEVVGRVLRARGYTYTVGCGAARAIKSEEEPARSGAEEEEPQRPGYGYSLEGQERVA